MPFSDAYEKKTSKNANICSGMLLVLGLGLIGQGLGLGLDLDLASLEFGQC